MRKREIERDGEDVDERETKEKEKMRRREIRLRERERERGWEKSQRCSGRDKWIEKEERRKTEKRERTNSFLELKKYILKVKKYYFNDIGKIKRICCGVFLYRKKKVVWFPKFFLY